MKGKESSVPEGVVRRSLEGAIAAVALISALVAPFTVPNFILVLLLELSKAALALLLLILASRGQRWVTFLTLSAIPLISTAEAGWFFPFFYRPDARLAILLVGHLMELLLVAALSIVTLRWAAIAPLVFVIGHLSLLEDRIRESESAPEEVNLKELVGLVVTMLREGGAESGPHTVVDVPADLTLSGHPADLHILISNLLRDAWAAAGPTGTVRLSAMEDREAVRIVVEDNGQEGGRGAVEPGSGDATPPEYRVLLDGQLLGTNLRSVDSILTGEHRLTVVSTIAGERRVLYDRRITVEEGATTRVSVILPNVDVEAERARVAELAGEARLREALEQLRAERERNGYDLAREYYLTSRQFIDPQAIREAALENAAAAAEFEIGLGQSLLYEGEWERGIASHQMVLELGKTFDQPDLFGYRDEVGYVAENWAEYRVQRARKPLPWLPLGISVLTLQTLIVSGSDSGTPPIDGIVLPALGTAAMIGVWNSSDWDVRTRKRDLRRYGRNPDRRLAQQWNPHRIELVAGTHLGETFTSSPSVTTSVDANQFGFDGTYYVVGVVPDGSGSSPPGGLSIGLRYWFTRRNGAQLRLMLESPFWSSGGDGASLSIFSPFGSDDQRVPASGPAYNIELIWHHTRNGRWILDLGLLYRRTQYEEPEYEPFLDDQAAELYVDELFGGSWPVSSNIFGLVTGLNYRFGRRPLRPWELGVNLNVERQAVSDGLLADRGPIYTYVLRFGLFRLWSAIPRAHKPRRVDPRGGALRAYSPIWGFPQATAYL